LGGGRARLSTIAELSELPSINLNHNHHNNFRSHFNHNNPHRTPSALGTAHNISSNNNTTNNNTNTSATATASNSRRLEPAQSGHLVISRDLVLEDLFVEGQEEAENAEEEVRQKLMANLKPTDILGPIHETRDFQLSSLTGSGRQWERQDQHVPQDEETHPDNDQDMEEDDEEEKNLQHESFVREDGESDLSSTALALKREYEALFGSKGAVDSERSGSDANGLLGYDNSDDLYPRGDDDEDDDDDFFGDEDDEEADEAEEEFYAMLDLNGGVGNMILGVSFLFSLCLPFPFSPCLDRPVRLFFHIIRSCTFPQYLYLLVLPNNFRTTSHGNRVSWPHLQVLDCPSLDQQTKRRCPWLFSPILSARSLQRGVPCHPPQHRHLHQHLLLQLQFSLFHASFHQQPDSVHPKSLLNEDLRQCPTYPLRLLQQLHQNLQPSRHYNLQIQLSAFWMVSGRSKSTTPTPRRALEPFLLPRLPRS
jgi:hypothetical protein